VVTDGASTVQDLRRRNRSRVLWDLYLNGPGSRQRVGAAAGVSPGTVSNVVGELMEERIVLESGSMPSGGGRPSAIVQVNPSYGYVVGVDVGESSVLVELFDLAMGVRATHRSSIEPGRLDPAHVVGQVAHGVRTVLAQADVAEGSVLGVGVGVPGVVEHAPLAVVHGQSIGWDAVPLEALLREQTDLPLAVGNGAKLLGQAEHWFGAAKGVDDAVIVLIGQGVGTSIFTSGSAEQGPMAQAGEWGHTVLELDGRTCRCGASGCLEAYVGAGALVGRYEQLADHADGAGRTRSTGQEDIEQRASELLARVDSDPVATQVVDEAVRYLGGGIANLVNLFSPRQVVIGGWLGRQLAARWMPEIQRATARNALRLPLRKVQLLRADLGADAVALGAATLPVAGFLSSGGAVGATAGTQPGAPV
jgi:predicted NBD/HSP70 family sugar kinase